MKSKTDSRAAHAADGLTFAWLRGDESVVRLWVSVFLAFVLFVAASFLLRVLVPVSVAVDPPQVSKAQLILVSPESHPSLKSFLEAGNLPSLGIKESAGDVPLVGEMLALLGLEEEEKAVIQLYPAPEIVPELAWPSKEGKGLTLLPLEAISEESWPTVSGPGEGWVIQFEAKGELGQLFEGEVFPWPMGEPVRRETLWSVAFDSDGALVFASAIESLDVKSDREIRRLLESFFEDRHSLRVTAPSLIKVRIKEKKE